METPGSDDVKALEVSTSSTFSLADIVGSVAGGAGGAVVLVVVGVLVFRARRQSHGDGDAVNVSDFPARPPHFPAAALTAEATMTPPPTRRTLTVQSPV